MKYKLFNLMFVFLLLLFSTSLIIAADSRGVITDTKRCVTVDSQDIEKICYDLNFKWRFEPVAFKAKFRIEPNFNITKVYWKKHIDGSSKLAKNKQKNIQLDQSIFSAKISSNKWFIFSTQKIRQNENSIQSKDLKWKKMVAKSCGDNNKSSECSCFTNIANSSERVSPFYVSGGTSKDLLRDGFELSVLKPCRLNFSGVTKEKKSNIVRTNTTKLINTTNEEVLYWNLIKRNPSLSKYQEYIKDYPNGQFTDIAKLNISAYIKNDVSVTNPNVITSAKNDPIAICNALLTSNQLTSGKSGNANACFKAILSHEPDNADAKSGLDAIEKRYVLWANKALNAGNVKKVESYIDKILLVNTDSVDAIKLRKRLANKQVQSGKLVEETISNFHTAINEKNINRAKKTLEKLKELKLEPSLYDDFNNKYIEMLNESYSLTIRKELDKNNLKAAKSTLDKLEKIVLDRMVFTELNSKYLALLEDSKKAHLNLTTNVSDSIVSVNDIPKGSAPISLSFNKGETYKVKITKKGYNTHIITMTLYNNRKFNVDLEKSARYIIRNGEKIPVSDSFAPTAEPVTIKPVIKPKKTVHLLPVVKDLGSGLEMVTLKRGCFMIGSPSGEQKRDLDEKQKKVCFKKGFKIGKYEVTQQQWQAIMGNNPSYFDKCGLNCPVEDIDWYAIQKYIKKLNNKIEYTSGYVYRLPTEAEWEYAARAGTTTPFNTGSCLSPELANYKLGDDSCIKTDGKLITESELQTNSKKSTKNMPMPVGSYPPNSWGLYDMHGNVAEWTCSEYFYTFNGSESRCHVGDLSITGEVENSYKITTRGGSWGFKYQWSRSAERDKDIPTSNNKNLGFRLVRE